MKAAHDTGSTGGWRKALAGGGRIILRLGVVLLALSALYVGAGRLLAPLAEERKEELEALLSRRLGAVVEIAHLDAGWHRFGPLLEVQGLRIAQASPGGAEPSLWHTIGNLSIQLDVPRSLLRRTWVSAAILVNSPLLELEEVEAGRWTLAGLETRSPGLLDRGLDLLLNTAQLRLDNARVVLHPAAGGSLALHEGSISLHNGEGRHELRMQAKAAPGGSPLRLMVDVSGDPRGRFSAVSYLEGDLAEAAGFLPLLRPAESQAWTVPELDGRLRLWAYLDESGLHEVRGQAQALTLRGQAHDAMPSLNLEEGTARFSARREAKGRWQLWLEDLAFVWEGARLHPADLFLRLNTNAPAPVIDLQAPYLNLTDAAALATALPLLPESGREALYTLRPRGWLRNLRLHADLGAPEALILEANLEDVAVEAWKAAPAVTGIQGYVRARGREGFAELDSRDFSLHLPRLFPSAWRYAAANSRVHWRVEPGRIQVGSSLIDARSPDAHGRVQFALQTRRNAAGRWESELDLVVGALSMDAAAKALYLPRVPALADTMNWLDGAIGDGRLHASGLVFRGRAGGEPPPGSSTVQGFFQAEAVSLSYLPDWPRLENARGSIHLRDREADIEIAEGSIAGIRLAPAAAVLRRNGEGSGSWLKVTGEAATDAAPGLDFLRRSPLGGRLGFLDDWKAAGPLQVSLELDVPIRLPQAQPDVKVEVLSENVHLEIPAHALAFERVAGRVGYSTREGLRAEGLQGSLWGFPLTAGIESFDSPLPGSVVRERGTRIRGSGRVSSEALAAWPAQSEFLRRLLGLAEGEMDYQADFRLYQDPPVQGLRAALSLSSPMRGLAVDLPEPFGKASAQELPLTLDIDFRDGDQLLNTRVGGRFLGRLVLKDASLDRGMLYFGPLNQDFSIRQSDSNEKGLLVAGELESLDLEAWRKVGEAFVTAEADGKGLAQNLRLVDVNIGRLEAFGHRLLKVNTQLAPTEQGWELSLRNEELGGTLRLPADDSLPYGLHLDYLRLPGAEVPEEGVEEAGQADALDSVDPRRLPALDFTADAIQVGERRLGSWRFKLRPVPGGVRFEDLSAEMLDARLADATGEAGADLEWLVEGGAHATRFTGRFLAGNLARALPALGYAANVESQSANFTGELAWPGSPAAFSLARSSGDLVLQIRNGRFVDIDSGGSRLFGALSFDALVRRLQLDFSDLFGKGFVYDSIDGGLDFDMGMVTTEGMVRISGPSSKISIDGRIDLANQTIDADMLVNLPLSQNISVVAGLLGAWPLAVSTYVAGKIFEEQVDEFTTLVYRLEGPWERLETNFEVPASAAAATPTAQAVPPERSGTPSLPAPPAAPTE